MSRMVQPQIEPDQSEQLRRTRVWRLDQFTGLGFDSATPAEDASPRKSGPASRSRTPSAFSETRPNSASTLRAAVSLLRPGDDYLLALAEAESALVISGDTHLLDLARRFPIQTPRVFLDALDAQP